MEKDKEEQICDYRIIMFYHSRETGKVEYYKGIDSRKYDIIYHVRKAFYDDSGLLLRVDAQPPSLIGLSLDEINDEIHLIGEAHSILIYNGRSGVHLDYNGFYSGNKFVNK